MPYHGHGIWGSGFGLDFAEWVRLKLERWMATGRFRISVRIPLLKTFRFGTLAIRFTLLCQCLSGETVKAVGDGRSLLSGVYARGSIISHQSALACVTVVDSTAHSKIPEEELALPVAEYFLLKRFTKPKRVDDG